MYFTVGKRPLAVIVLNPAGTDVEKHAAFELNKYIMKLGGVELQVADTSSEEHANIYIGSSAPLGSNDLPELGYDGYVVKTIEDGIILTGIKSYSCLYAVYHLLERYLGCGFFEDGDQIPEIDTLKINEIYDICKPRFELRSYSLNMQYAYSGMQWWDWDQLKAWCDWMVKKRFNMWEPLRILESIGLVAAAATRMGIPIEHTKWQKERIALMRRVIEYARMLGIRTVYGLNQYNQGMEGNQNEPGAYPYPDRMQLEEFIRRYEEKTGKKVPVNTYKWCGIPLPAMDPRHSITQQFITALVEAYTELFGTDHLYPLSMPSEGEWDSDDIEEMNRVSYAMLINLIDAIKTGDPEAVIFTRPPFEYAKTFEVQKKAVKDAGIPIVADFWLNVPGRMHGFIMNDYYWGLPWATGMISHCGTHTNPWGDIRVAVRNARELISDPRSDRCMGFLVGNEINHRNIMMIDLFTELAWNPSDVEIDDYIVRYTTRRYGANTAGRLVEAVSSVASTLLSNCNMDNTNGPLYRRWRGGYLPGTTPVSVKRTLSYLPRLRFALEILLEKHDQLKDSPLYRFDMVDLGRTYLSAVFNNYLARTRKAFRAQQKDIFELYAEKTLEVMHFMARYCSADPQFRLKTYDDWAKRWSEVLPGYNNNETNQVIFTALISRTNWKQLLDYMAEDMAELIEHYYVPRVELYIDKMRQLLDEGKDISGRLVYRGTDRDMPNRISDWATPRGILSWSPYGAPCEPELTAEDDELAHSIIEDRTISGKYDFYEGTIDVLACEMLDRYPVPDDLADVLFEPEAEIKEVQCRILEGKPGDITQGFHTLGVVEKVIIPKELEYLVKVEEISKEYNIVRGNIASYRVDVSDYLELHRLPDGKSITGEHNVAMFEFETLNKKYVLIYDPGSNHMVTGLFIETAEG